MRNQRQFIKRIKNAVQEMNDIKSGKLEGRDLDDFLNSLEDESAKSRQQRLDRLEELTKNTRVDLSNFKFDRDEANSYDD